MKRGEDERRAGRRRGKKREQFNGEDEKKGVGVEDENRRRI